MTGAQHIPLLSPKAFSEYSPQEFADYVRSLYREPPRPPPPAEYSARLNKKGNPVITVRRNPKYLTAEEVTAISQELGLPLQTLWLRILKGKKIEIRVPKALSAAQRRAQTTVRPAGPQS